MRITFLLYPEPGEFSNSMKWSSDEGLCQSTKIEFLDTLQGCAKRFNYLNGIFLSNIKILKGCKTN